MAKVLRGVFILILVGAVGVAGAGWYLSGLLLFREKPRAAWRTQQEPECSPWMRNVAFADLRVGAPDGKALDATCEDAMALPHESRTVKAENGFDIHYNVYANPTGADAYAATGPGSTTGAENGASPEGADTGNAGDGGRGAPLFLHVHGVSGNFLHGARYFQMASRLGFQLVAMDLSNHGRSSRNGKGAAYGCREQLDVVAVVDDLKARYPGRDIYLHATSMGAMAVANALPRLMADDSQRRIVALSLENPIPSVREIVTESPYRPPVPDGLIDVGLAIAGWRAGFNFESCKPSDTVRFARVPVLVQWSEKDDLVTRSLTNAFMAALPADVPHVLEIFPGGGHSAVWNGDPERYEAQTRANWREGLRWRGERLLGRRP